MSTTDLGWTDATWSAAWRTISGYWPTLRFDDDGGKESAWRNVLTRTARTEDGTRDVFPIDAVARACALLAETEEKAPALSVVVQAVRREAGARDAFAALPTRDDVEPVDAAEEDERALYRRAREKQAAGRSMSICEALLVRPDADLERHAATIATRQVARAGGGVVGDYVRAAFAACPNRTLQRMVVRRFEKLGHTAAAERLAVEIASTSGGTR